MISTRKINGSVAVVVWLLSKILVFAEAKVYLQWNPNYYDIDESSRRRLTMNDPTNNISRILSDDDPTNLKGFLGDPNCPCLESEKTLQEALKHPNYGIGCDAHDILLEECAVPEGPSWCRRSWCWVDSQNCGLLNKLATVGHYYSTY